MPSSRRRSPRSRACSRPVGEKRALVPARRDARFVVRARRVGLEDDADAQVSTLVAGPVSSASTPTKRTVSSPPGNETTTGSQPNAAATATALEPEDAVSPAPRSQTRASIRSPCAAPPARSCVAESARAPRAAGRSAAAPPDRPRRPRAGCRRRPSSARMPSTSSGSPIETAPRFCSTRSPGEHAGMHLARRRRGRPPRRRPCAQPASWRRSACRCRTSRPGSRRGSRSRSRASLAGPEDLEDAVGVAHLGTDAVRRQRPVISDEVDVPLRLPARRSHRRPPPQTDPQGG